MTRVKGLKRENERVRSLRPEEEPEVYVTCRRTNSYKRRNGMRRPFVKEGYHVQSEGMKEV